MDLETFKKLLPYLVALITALTSGGVIQYKGTQTAKSADIAIHTLLDAYKGQANANIRLCKETKGRVCDEIK